MIRLPNSWLWSFFIFVPSWLWSLLCLRRSRCLPCWFWCFFSLCWLWGFPDGRFWCLLSFGWFWRLFLFIPSRLWSLLLLPNGRFWCFVRWIFWIMWLHRWIFVVLRWI